MSWSPKQNSTYKLYLCLELFVFLFLLSKSKHLIITMPLSLSCYDLHLLHHLECWKNGYKNHAYRHTNKYRYKLWDSLRAYHVISVVLSKPCTKTYHIMTDTPFQSFYQHGGWRRMKECFTRHSQVPLNIAAQHIFCHNLVGLGSARLPNLYTMTLVTPPRFDKKR